jgi:predicted MPP superfamily phosphohydrolase
MTLPRPATTFRRIHRTNETASRPSTPTPAVEIVRRGPWLQFVRPGPFEFSRALLPIRDLPPALDGLRILHLTDLHIRPTWFRDYDDLLDRVRAAPPDLVLLTGDFVERRILQRRAVDNAERFCRGLTSRLGTFAITGNHDGDFLAPRMADWNLTIIEDTRVTITDAAKDTTIELIGLPGVNRLDFDESFVERIPPKPRNAVRIVLSHYPDQAPLVGPLRPDLMLAGHTHGGQCCLPGRIPIITHDDLPRRYASGVHRWDQMWLVVSRGLGFATLPWRTFCPTEVMEVVLKRET